MSRARSHVARVAPHSSEAPPLRARRSGRYSPNITGNHLAAMARHNGDGEAIVCHTHRTTWRELHRRVNRLARAMGRWGVQRGDTVALVFHDTQEFIEVNFAAQLCGAIPVPFNYRLTAQETARQLEHCDARVLLYDAMWSAAVEGALDRLGPKAPPHVFCHNTTHRAGIQAYDALLAAGSDEPLHVATAPDDVAVMVYTGGTTGLPRGVLLTYGAHQEMFASLLAQLMTRGAQLDLSVEQLRRVVDTMPVPGLKYLAPLTRSRMARRIFAHPCTTGLLRRGLLQLLTRPELARVGYRFPVRYMTPSMPLFHDASYQMLMLGLMAGNLTFLLSTGPTFDARQVLLAIQRERPFFLANVPTGWKKLVQHLLQHHDPPFTPDLSSVRVAATGAGVCSAELKRQIMTCFPGVIVLDMLGQTEMTPVTAFRIDARPDTLKDRSVGQTIVQSRIVDEQGLDLPRGAVGEILYRSSTQMKGYYKDPEATASITRDGWLHSGDVGYLDEEGELRLVDRKQECINTGGEKVYPTEVEQVLGQHPAVEQACVVGIDDAEWGQAVRAVIQLKPATRLTADELTDFCRPHLAGFKIPRQVVFVDQLPLSAVGKVLRSQVRQLYG